MTPEHLAKMQAGRKAKRAQAEAITETANQLLKDSPEVFEPPAVIDVANLPKAPKKESKPMATDANKIENWLNATFNDGDEAEDLFWDTLTTFVEKRQEEYAALRAEKDARIKTRQGKLKQLLLFTADDPEEETSKPAASTGLKKDGTPRKKPGRKAGTAPATPKAKAAKSALQAPKNAASEKAVLAVLTNRFQSCADIAKKLGAGYSPADVKPAADALVAANKAQKEPGKKGPYPSIRTA
jgi:hypothetical protein